MLIGKTLKEQLLDIENKLKILKENNLMDTTNYYMLINSRSIIRDQLASQLLKQSEETK